VLDGSGLGPFEVVEPVQTGEEIINSNIEMLNEFHFEGRTKVWAYDQD
jgi:hypothetical protein